MGLYERSQQFLERYSHQHSDVFSDRRDKTMIAHQKGSARCSQHKESAVCHHLDVTLMGGSMDWSTLYIRSSPGLSPFLVEMDTASFSHCLPPSASLISEIAEPIPHCTNANITQNNSQQLGVLQQNPRGFNMPRFQQAQVSVMKVLFHITMSLCFKTLLSRVRVCVKPWCMEVKCEKGIKLNDISFT